MLGRGVKRKRGIQEDQLVGSVDAVDPNSASGVSYLQQRQLVLTLCLDKLQGCQIFQGCQIRTEPSLHRSVLLVNTLRQIQEEMRQEGEESVAFPAVTATAPLHATPPLQSPSLTCGAQPAVASSAPQDLFDFSGLDTDSSLLTCPGCSEEEEEDELEVSLVSSSFTSMPPSLLSLDDPPSPDGRTRGFHSLLGSYELVNSPGYLSDLALDDIFEDIDTSMYDASDVSSILALGSSRVASLSSTVGGDDAGLKVATSCPSAARQLCFSEVSDLDHIMEVLVGS
ncbi:SERTA domain-containing protein 2-like [Clupea harengus]|uniref:SERTA domain-containing protein 2-like n=1 Tax=Clupea harengus TaxID=7950 RepID=A0A6P3VPA3_CLUHA|nr:SERTA domain-containing protein 2-like [Clupea harengus]